MGKVADVEKTQSSIILSTRFRREADMVLPPGESFELCAPRSAGRAVVVISLRAQLALGCEFRS